MPPHQPPAAYVDRLLGPRRISAHAPSGDLLQSTHLRQALLGAR
jgi:hypothetical protein